MKLIKSLLCCTAVFAASFCSDASDYGFIRDIEPYSVRMMLSEMARNPQAVYLDARAGERKWNYTTGLELRSFLDVAYRYELDYAVDYVKEWADTMAADDGKVYKYKLSNYNVDHICPARIYFDLYRIYGDKKYRRVLRNIREQLDSQPRTATGEFWHKQIYPHQVWLDGLYMALPFYARYTSSFSPKAERDSLYRDIVHQFAAAAENTFDPVTGLFRHAWDESRSMFWADPVTGQSAHAWGRANGWYAVALVEVLDIMPKNTPGRDMLAEQLEYLLTAVERYSDPRTGMWYQVLDCPGREGNYLESTASAMFVYAALKGARMRCLGPQWRDKAMDLYRRLIDTFIRENGDGTISMTSCCSVAGLGGKQMRKGDYAYYLSEPVIENDCKGVGPFIWASLEYEAMHDIDYVFDGKCIRDGRPVNETVVRIPAFDGALGGGMYAQGGRGGKEYVVTSLEDTGEPGTLRHAVEAKGPRVVTFAVSGDIRLKKPLRITEPYLTVLGQTAPGSGITLRDFGVHIVTDQVVVRYMRFRMGSAGRQEDDALEVRHSDNVMIDHCSISWATDENASLYANTNTTMQWCIISEALNSSVHRKGQHGYGGIWGGRNVTFHHNLIVSNNSRNPRFDHPAVYSGEDLLFRRGTVEFVNNVVFNWGMKAIYGGEEGWFNVAGNLFKVGPAARNIDGRYLEFYTSESTSLIPGSFYIEDNVYDVSAVRKGNAQGKMPEYDKIERNEDVYSECSAVRPYPSRCPVVPEPVRVSYRKILKDAGASAVRDAIDRRIVKEVKTGKVTFRGSATGLPGIIDSENDIR